MERAENKTEVNIGFGKGRIESLTDGIFAFGMTLLVLGAGYPFAVETLAGRPVSQILVQSVPDIILYVISFLILATFWVSHHTQFHHIRSIDRTLLWLNIIILMFIAFIPFSSSIAGVFPANPLAAGVSKHTSFSPDCSFISSGDMPLTTTVSWILRFHRLSSDGEAK